MWGSEERKGIFYYPGKWRSFVGWLARQSANGLHFTAEAPKHEAVEKEQAII